MEIWDYSLEELNELKAEWEKVWGYEDIINYWDIVKEIEKRKRHRGRR